MKGIHIDRKRHLADDPKTGHNRWHPDIAPLIEVDEGEEVALETRNALDGYLTSGPASAFLPRRLWASPASLPRFSRSRPGRGARRRWRSAAGLRCRPTASTRWQRRARRRRTDCGRCRDARTAVTST